MLKIELLPPFENVAANQIAILPRIPQGKVYHGIGFKLGGTTFTKSLITEIKLRLGGKVIWDISGDQLDSINKYLGMTANANYLLIPFSELNSKTILGEAIGALDTKNFNYSGFSAEISIGAATAPTLKAWAFTTDDKIVENPAHLPIIRAMIPSTHNKSAAGKYNLPIPMGSSLGGLLKRIHMFHTNLSAFQVKLNGSDLQDVDENGLVQFWQNNLTRITQAGHLAFDPLTRDNQSDSIPTIDANGRANNFEFNATFGASDTVKIITEMYSTINTI